MTTRSLATTLTVRTLAVQGTAWIAWLRRVLQAAESRRHLAEMDRRMLSDIGITRSEALEEAARAPWDLTPSRR
ncbi:DUF1127 domain-containing protein [Neoroseomonas oryzicola]|uniref:DUF1127 domain-containing protein n=1 Tax=Neoroseomonas oryzicola TaxID=535904 RepID=A0A9X9WM65_9PROT|nr:DUF1127 domain-containing protein [Neoroseomonas oryzicola]MBR0661425.1 DUF1127 domain-containing protein [Neoroseomonas oryzicola]NKE19155.1 DUF1127 domain-containing protein [Neoroseomonas oryzicola]